jgi:hypothetical protein
VCFSLSDRKGLEINLYQTFFTLKISFESLRGYKENLVWRELIEIIRGIW